MDSTLEIEAVGMVSPRGEAGYLVPVIRLPAASLIPSKSLHTQS